MKSLFVITLILALTGCGTPRYSEVHVDSSSPANAYADADALQRCPAELKMDKTCTARIQANQWTSSTGIQVQRDETYCIAVLPNQVWFDADRRNTPPYGEKGSWIMNLANKRHDGAGFFALMVNVKPADNAEREHAAMPVEKLSNHSYRATVEGELVLYPNDAVSPRGDPAYYYENNSGFIWVKITRCTDG